MTKPTTNETGMAKTVADAVLLRLASLKFTVALLGCSMLLLFVGTLAQVHLGVWQAVEHYFRSPLAWVTIPLGDGGISIPLPGGLLLGSLLAVNLVASLILRWKFFLKRPALLVVHLGLLVLIAGEAGTSAWAEEGLMTIHEGQRSWFAEDIRSVELALIDPNHPDGDRVVRVPASVLLRAHHTGHPIRDPQLPVTIEVVQWVANARLVRASTQGPASHGIGQSYVPHPEPQARGVDGASADTPAALLRLREATTATDLGTWLVSPHLRHAQPIAINGATHGLTLRFRRMEIPVTLHLDEFRFDRFVGTEIPRNFSSRVRVIESADENDAGREVVISMNQPLRTHGYTFFQASFMPDEDGTVLQVVRNPAADLPYIASVMVGLGLLAHFLLSLGRFSRRHARRRTTTTATTAVETAARSVWQRAWPWGMGVFAVAVAVGVPMGRTTPSTFDLETFRRLPVTADGRVKPIDTAARNLLMVAGGRQRVITEAGTIDPVVAYLDFVARPERAKSYPIIRIDHPDVLALIGRGPHQGGRLSLEAIESGWSAIAEQAARAHQVDPPRRDSFQRAVVQAHAKIERVVAHIQMLQPYLIPPAGPDEDWQPFREAFVAAHAALPEGHPTLDGDRPPPNPAIAWYVTMMTAYHDDNAEGFNRAAASYAALVDRDLAELSGRAKLEVWFNRVGLFASATVLYVLAFALFLLGFLFRVREAQTTSSVSPAPSARGTGVAETWRRLAFAWMASAFVLHTVALVLRMYIQERPPVTNLYSSAIFIGWAAVIGGLFLERIYRSGLAGLGTTLVAFLTLVVADTLGTDGDTLQMMQAVLDSNFWLATHVVTITLGYSASFLAGALAAVYLVLGMWTKHLTPERAKSLTAMVYAAVCTALLASFVGTVLGGIWADQSWGRFWGWDPKENGAAMIVLLHAMVLHGRWGGLLRPRGIMVVAVFGNIVTAWSWFGTNMLGVGLHAYGFMDSGIVWLIVFVAANFALMLLGASSGAFASGGGGDGQPQSA